MKYTFEYGQATVGDLTVRTGTTLTNGMPRVAGVEMDGELLAPTPRFWRSFFNRFGIAENVFRYFSHQEVFERITRQSRSDSFRYCVERNAKGDGRLLAVTNPGKNAIAFNRVRDIVTEYDGQELRYHDGIVESTHVPRSGDAPFQIGADEFKHRFVLETPIDGYGLPKIHLALLRLLCENGAIGYTRAFRSEINAGKDVAHGLIRSLNTFDNGEGYAALRQRFESAQKSWASLHEVHNLYRLLTRQRQNGDMQNATILADFNRVTGRVHEIYGLANLDALSAKRQRVLPAKCRVYDLLNFASEIATHHAGPRTSQTLQAYIGSLIADEYDMEGTAERVAEFSDFFVTSSDANRSVLRN